MASNIDLFFNTSRNKRTFPEVLAEIQEFRKAQAAKRGKTVHKKRKKYRRKKRDA